MPAGGETGSETGVETSSETSSETGANSVAVTLDVGSLNLFDPKGDPHGLSQRWKRWK